MEEQEIEDILALVEDGRNDEALEALDAIIAENNDQPRLHAMRAFILVDLGRLADAHRAAELAHALDDEDPYVLNALGRVAIAVGEPSQAISAARKLYEFFPGDHEAILLEARARAMLGQWDEVMSRADYVLREDPQDAEAAFLRIAAIESRKRPGQKLDAAEWDRLAEQFPHIGFARTGRAWTLLDRGRGRHAEAEFRDALALDPSDTIAKEGLVLALKTRYPGYTLLLRFFFWLQSLEPRTQMMVLIGGVVGMRMLRRVADGNPALRPFLWPVLIAYFTFVLATWLADPLLNLVLMTKAEGRRLLTDDDRSGAKAVGATLAVGIALLLIGGFTPWDRAMLGGLVVTGSSLTLAAAFHCAPGKYRRRLYGAALTFIGCGLFASVVPPQYGTIPVGVALLGIVVSTWISRSFIKKSYQNHSG